ncbi:MAG: UDP-N-acetylmuramyl-tripeptide synthetase, partial [Planctomycetaceae bacterium]
IVTGITHDHLDYHVSPEAYRQAKRKIFTHLKRGALVLLCADDPVCMSLLGDVPGHARVRTFGINSDADIQATSVACSRQGTRFRVQNGASCGEIETSLIGAHNVLNCLAAIGATEHFGVEMVDIQQGLAGLKSIPGRLERVDAEQPFSVYIDYAHTEDAIRRAIESVRRVTTGRVLIVFGAGGDRDASKRFGMGRAGSLADLCFLTSDNPRSESPEAIIEQIRAGFEQGRCELHVETDRQLAIEKALQLARPGDAVLIAGKGHETVQVIGSQRIPFDDAQVCRQFLKQFSSGHQLSPQRRTA